MRLKVILKSVDEDGNLLYPHVKVVDLDTGAELKHVRAVSFATDGPDDIPVLKLEVFGFEAEVEQVNRKS